MARAYMIDTAFKRPSGDDPRNWYVEGHRALAGGPRNDWQPHQSTDAEYFASVEALAGPAKNANENAAIYNAHDQGLEPAQAAARLRDARKVNEMNATEGKDVQVREFDGHGWYGPWISLASPDLPQWVVDSVLDELAKKKEEGEVERAGSMWRFRTVNS